MVKKSSLITHSQRNHEKVRYHKVFAQNQVSALRCPNVPLKILCFERSSFTPLWSSPPEGSGRRRKRRFSRFWPLFLTRESPLMTDFHFSFLHLRPVVKSYHLRCRTKNFTIKQKNFQKWPIFVAGHARSVEILSVRKLSTPL